jgi:hypothetical protein
MLFIQMYRYTGMSKHLLDSLVKNTTYQVLEEYLET